MVLHKNRGKFTQIGFLELVEYAYHITYKKVDLQTDLSLSKLETKRH
jgi:hypothetical protein